LRIEHWNEAINQGSVAALNMLDKKVPHDQIPFFWTRHWDKSLQYTGFASDFNDTYIEGDVNKLDFIVYYLKDDQVVAAAAMNKSPVPMIINQAMTLNVMPKGSELKSGKVDMNEIKRRIAAKKGSCKCKKDACCKTNYVDTKGH